MDDASVASAAGATAAMLVVTAAQELAVPVTLPAAVMATKI